MSSDSQSCLRALEQQERDSKEYKRGENAEDNE